MGRRMATEVSIGQNEVHTSEGGGGVTGIQLHFIYTHIISDRCSPYEKEKNG